MGIYKVLKDDARFPKTLRILRAPGPYVFIEMKKLCNPRKAVAVADVVAVAVPLAVAVASVAVAAVAVAVALAAVGGALAVHVPVADAGAVADVAVAQNPWESIRFLKMLPVSRKP